MDQIKTINRVIDVVDNFVEGNSLNDDGKGGEIFAVPRLEDREFQKLEEVP